MDLTELGISGQGSALVCVKDQDKLAVVVQAVKALGIGTISQSLSQKEALDKLKYNQFDLVVIQDGFGGDLETSELMAEFWNMDISQRRKVFLVLLGDRWETGNALHAFTLSVNLVVNYKLLDKIKEGIGSAMMRNQRFYKQFLECREALGKI